MLHYDEAWSSADPDVRLIELYEDNGVPEDTSGWTNLLDGATTVTVEWSKNGGATWPGSYTIELADMARRKLKVNVPAAAADGTEYLLRFTIDGTLYGPISVRWYR